MTDIYEVKESTDEASLEKIIALRYELLRKPWKQSYESARDELEAQSVNAFIADKNGNVIAIGRLHKINGDVAQIRYMAVAEPYRGKGLGRVILKHLEKRAAEKGHNTIILQARENAVQFYIRHGYVVKEKTFLLWGEVQHYLMEKVLILFKA